MVSWDTCISASPGNSAASRRAICQGDHHCSSHSFDLGGEAGTGQLRGCFGRRARSQARRWARHAR